MPLMLHCVDGGYIPAFEYLPANNAPLLGQALVVTNGKLVSAGSSKPPLYVGMGAPEGFKNGSNAAVLRVHPNLVFETQTAAAGTSYVLGDLVSLDSSGTKVNAKNAAGVAEVVWYAGGTKAGTKIRVRFGTAAVTNAAITAAASS